MNTNTCYDFARDYSESSDAIRSCKASRRQSGRGLKAGAQCYPQVESGAIAHRKECSRLSARAGGVECVMAGRTISHRTPKKILAQQSMLPNARAKSLSLATLNLEQALRGTMTM